MKIDKEHPLGKGLKWPESFKEAIRQHGDMSLNNIAKKMNINISSLRRYRKGQIPRYRPTAKVLAEALGWTSFELSVKILEPTRHNGIPIGWPTEKDKGWNLFLKEAGRLFWGGHVQPSHDFPGHENRILDHARKAKAASAQNKKEKK